MISIDDTRALNRLLARREVRDVAFERRVRAIVDRVRDEGDRAVVRFARRYDGVSGPLEVTAGEMRAGAAGLEPAVRRAIAQAARAQGIVEYPLNKIVL